MPCCWILREFRIADPDGRVQCQSVRIGLVTGVVDGWMAHGKKGADGNWTYPNEINWRTDAERVGDGGGVATPLSIGLGRLSLHRRRQISDADPQPHREERRRLAQRPQRECRRRRSARPIGARRLPRPRAISARVAGWDATGNRKLLEEHAGDAIAFKSQHMYMYTEGHWWTDRVDSPTTCCSGSGLAGSPGPQPDLSGQHRQLAFRQSRRGGTGRDPGAGGDHRAFQGDRL